MEGVLKYTTPLFDGKGNFTLWQSTIEDILVQHGLDVALEERKPETMKEEEWKIVQRKAVSTIRLALAPQVKFEVIKETSPKALWDKLEEIYASKSLTNRLFMKMEMYSLKMEEGGNLHDHINKFNQLVCQLQNVGEKVEDEEQALLLLASLLKSYKPLVQTVCAGKTTLNLIEVTTVLRQNERMMKGESTLNESEKLLAMENNVRERNQNRRRNDQRYRSKSRPRDYSKMECYYCEETGHIQHSCPKLKEDLKSLKQLQEKMKGKLKIEDGDSSSVVRSDDESDDEFHLVKEEDVAGNCSSESNSNWAMDSASDAHICRDRAMFDTLHTDGRFGNINVGNKLKLKVEGVGSVRLKVHSGVVQNIFNVKFVPSAGANVISLGELAAKGYKYTGVGNVCKVFKGGRLVMLGRKKGKNICYLDGYSLKRSGSSRVKKAEKTVKRVRFSDHDDRCGIVELSANSISVKGEPGKSILKKTVKTQSAKTSAQGGAHGVIKRCSSNGALHVVGRGRIVSRGSPPNGGPHV